MGAGGGGRGGGRKRREKQKKSKNVGRRMKRCGRKGEREREIGDDDDAKMGLDGWKEVSSLLLFPPAAVGRRTKMGDDGARVGGGR